MRISRLYVSASLAEGRQTALNEDSGHYVRTVLRLKKDDPIILFNGHGGEYVCTVLEASRKCVLIMVQKWLQRSVESPLHITAGIGISRGDKMDLVVQKSVELGVNVLTPLLTERCVVQLKDEKRQQRLLHWQKIVQHAAEQSGRTALPQLQAIDDLHKWLDKQQGLKVFLDPYAETSLAELQPEDMKVTLLSGPEGGFTGQEREMAKAAGFIPVRLGHRILRTETAALAAISSAQMLWGDFRGITS